MYVYGYNQRFFRLIYFLRDTEEPLSIGLMYVGALFAVNFFMSVCLRQYFW